MATVNAQCTPFWRSLLAAPLPLTPGYHHILLGLSEYCSVSVISRSAEVDLLFGVHGGFALFSRRTMSYAGIDNECSRWDYEKTHRQRTRKTVDDTAHEKSKRVPEHKPEESA